MQHRLVTRANERPPSRRAFLKSRAILKTRATAAGACMGAVWVFAINFLAVAAGTMSQVP